MTKKSENATFLTARFQFLVQDIKISLEYVEFYTKESLILDTRVSNSTTPLTLLHSLQAFQILEIFCQNSIGILNEKEIL